MRIDLIPAGDSPPDSLNVLIEVPIGGEPVKYEFDKASGALFVDRFLHTPMRYPANYGFIPHTLGEDGDPLDALVVARSPVVAGAVVKCRPIGVLKMEDDGGGDEKLLCVPVNSTFPYYANVASYSDMPPIVLQQIEHFFAHYKDLEPGKWVKLGGWGDVDEAKAIILQGIERAKAKAAVNVHVGAAEAGHDIVFLHEIQAGPASRSYGIQVAKLAGMPAAVLHHARHALEALEAKAGEDDLQVNLFDAPELVEDTPAHNPLAQALADINPDQLSPREALEALYQLKKLNAA